MTNKQLISIARLWVAGVAANPDFSIFEETNLSEKDMDKVIKNIKNISKLLFQGDPYLSSMHSIIKFVKKEKQ